MADTTAAPARVAVVVDPFPVLSETFVAGEIAELRRRGTDVRILALRRAEATFFPGLASDPDLEAIACYDRDAFASIVAAFRPALLHAHFATEPTAEAMALARRFGLPFTFTAHGYDVWRRPPADFAARAAAAARVVTVSEANARRIAQAFGVPRQRIAVIRNGVDTEAFRPREAAAGGDEAPLIVCVARHEPVKRHDLLLDALALLARRGVRFRCASVGDGSLRPKLQARARELGLAPMLEFAGAVRPAEVVGWWQRAAVAVLASDSEGLPVSLIEAAACGVPAVATAVGGVAELVRDGVTGMLAPPGDAAALAAALESLLARPDAARAMGRAARRAAVEHFSRRQQIDALLALWADVLRSHARDGAAREATRVHQ